MIYISNLIMPIITMIVIIYALIKKVDIYDAFINGVKEGFQICLEIFPSIFIMIVAVSVFTKSNIINDLISVIKINVFPKEILPLALLRPISGSSSIMLLNNILSNYGPDSIVGKVASIITASTDTTIYIIGLYFGSIKIKKIKHALLVGLLADLICIIISIYIIKIL